MCGITLFFNNGRSYIYIIYKSTVLFRKEIVSKKESVYKSRILSTLPHSGKWQPLYLIRYSPFGLAVTVLLTEHP